MTEGDFIADELGKFADLRESGVLSEDEFHSVKARLLGSAQSGRSFESVSTGDDTFQYDFSEFGLEERSSASYFLLEHGIPHIWDEDHLTIPDDFVPVFEAFLDQWLHKDVEPTANGSSPHRKAPEGEE